MKALLERIKQWFLAPVEWPRWFVLVAALVMVFVAVEELGYWSNGVLLIVGIAVGVFYNKMK